MAGIIRVVIRVIIRVMIRDFAIDSKFACGTIYPLKKSINVDDGVSNYVCYNNNLCYLMFTSGEQTCTGYSTFEKQDCNKIRFEPVPGRDSLDGSACGGIKIDDIIQG